MKNFILTIIVSMFCLVSFSQNGVIRTLTINTDTVIFYPDNNNQGMFTEFSKWLEEGSLIKLTRAEAASYNVEEGRSIYFIDATKWEPTNNEIINIRIAGAAGNTENYVLYWRVTDSTFFDEDVSAEFVDRIDKIEGRYTVTRKSWGEYLSESHTIYYRESLGDYIISGTNDRDEPLTLEKFWNIKNAYPKIIGFMTEPTLQTLIGNSQVIHISQW